MAESTSSTYLRALFQVIKAPLRPVMTKPYQREIYLAVSIGVCAFFYVAISSFSPFDNSLYSSSYPVTRPANLAGRLGAEIAGFAFYLGGAVAWILPLPLLWGMVLVAKERSPWSVSTLLGWSVALASTASLCTAALAPLPLDQFLFPSGGAVGSFINQFFKSWLGTTGTYIILITSLLSAAALIFRFCLFETMLKKLGHFARWSGESLFSSLRLAAFATRPKFALSGQGLFGARNLPDSEGNGFSDPNVFAKDAASLPVLDMARPLLFSALASDANLSDSVPTKSIPQPTVSHWDEYSPPPITIFNKTESGVVFDSSELEITAQLLISTFADFGIHGKMVGFQPGPVVTVYEFQPDSGVKQSKVIGLIDDLALALKVDSLFIHPVKGKRALGIQVPNKNRETVHLGDVLETATFKKSPSPLTFGMGKSLNGDPVCADLTSMPHLLAAGATGSGKSVAINGLLCSIIMKASPEHVKMILVDPKMLELSVYCGIPHLLMPVITEPTKASLALKWAAEEMERRYKLMQHACVRNIEGFNKFLESASEERLLEINEAIGDSKMEKLPYILLVIDELADLMLTAPKDVEQSIQRLAQKARASGIHMVLATQRPSVDIITGVIKANLPCRIAFQVVSKHDSRTILDLNGAEKLLGKGDFLLQRPGIGRLERIQGALITDQEVLDLVANVKAKSNCVYDNDIIDWIESELARQDDQTPDMMDSASDDIKLDEAVIIARSQGMVSASFLQRQLKIGYNRAARMVEFMESQGWVERANGAKPRKWLGDSL